MVSPSSKGGEAGIQKKVIETQLEYAESETTNLRKELEDWLSVVNSRNTMKYIYIDRKR